MNPIKRGVLTLCMLVSGSAFAAEITIDTAKPGAVIHKDVYGQFAEHLARRQQRHAHRFGRVDQGARLGAACLRGAAGRLARGQKQGRYHRRRFQKDMAQTRRPGCGEG